MLKPDYPGDAEEYYRQNDPKKIARNVYPDRLRQRIKKAQIVILPSFTPAILCPDMTVAMFVFAAYRGIAVCLNCQKLFALDSERADGSVSEKYCTVACGSRSRRKLYRLNKKTGRKGKR